MATPMLRGWMAATFVLGLFSPLATAGEEPADGACDATGRIVCAGADGAGNVNCAFVTPTSVRCDWTSGILWSGFSPIGLPGEVEGKAAGFVETCIDTICSRENDARDLPFCSWTPLGECVDGETKAGSVGPIELVMGQCLKVTASETISVTARVLSSDLEVRDVTFVNSGEGAGQECLVDDGR